MRPKLQPFSYETDERFVHLGLVQDHELSFFETNLETQDFSTDPAGDSRQVLTVLAIFAFCASALVGALCYFAGPIVASVVTFAVALLVTWGNWIVSNTIDL